jgi:multiple sugar transport system substrate-binding protein
MINLEEENMTTKKLSRRDFLKFSGMAAAGAVLASCAKTPTPAPTTAATTAPVTSATEAPTQAPPPAKVEGNVVIMHKRGELSEAQETQFETDNPGITIELIEDNLQRFFAMLAAGSQLDLYRTQAPVVPSLLARKLLHDLTPYFQTSALIKVDDLADANKGYWAKSALEIGEGNIYGMCKDFSPDEAIWVNDALFEAAGVAPLDDTTPLTFDKLHEVAAQVAKFEGDRIATWGYSYETGWTDRFWMVALAETGKSLYKDGFTAVDFGDDAKALANWYFNMAKEHLSANPVDVSTNGWFGTDFTAGILAMAQYGYWFGGMAESDSNRGKVRMLPAPTWTGTHMDPTVTATGMVMMSGTQLPDAAWKVFEWYNGGQPSIDRAGSGWGVPALKSQWPLMPANTPFQQQVQKVLTGELAVNNVKLQFNPFLGEGTFVNAWTTHLQEALTGAISFDDLCSKTASDVNILISEGIDRLG